MIAPGATRSFLIEFSLRPDKNNHCTRTFSSNGTEYILDLIKSEVQSGFTVFGLSQKIKVKTDFLLALASETNRGLSTI